MPRIDDPKETTQMLAIIKGLADMFGDIQRPMKLESIIEKNAVLEKVERITAKKDPNIAIAYLSRRPIRFMLSNVFSSIVILGILLVQSVMVNSNFAEAFSNTTNFLALLGLVIALGYGIFEVTKKL